MMPPYMANEDSMKGTGQLPKFKEDMFKLEGLDRFLTVYSDILKKLNDVAVNGVFLVAFKNECNRNDNERYKK